MRSGLEGSCILLLQNQKWKQRKFLVFKEIFLERGEVFLEWISFHAIWSQLQHPVLVGSVAVQGLLLILVQQPQQPQRLLLLYCRIYCWFNIEKLVSLSHTTKCFALSAALLGFDICHARGTLSCLLLTAVNTTVLVSFAYLHTQKELLLLLCERIFFFKVASRASTAFSTWQACDFSQRQTLQKRPSNKKEKRNKAVFCQNGEEDVLISFLHFHCGKMHHYLPCFSSLLLPWSFEFIMEFLWKWVDE